MNSPTEAKNRKPKVMLLVGVAVLVLLGVVLGASALMSSKRHKAEEVAKAEAAAQADTVPQNQWIEWEEGQPVSNFHVAGFDIQMTAGLDDDLRVPVMTVTAPDGQTVQVHGEGKSGKVSARFAVVQLNAASDERQILFSSFSYGAHCCAVPYLVEMTKDGWRTVTMGAWDGDQIELPKDVDGDGIKEFVLRDQGFLYSFSPYADSYPPIVVYAVNDGRFEDVSGQTKYRELFIDELPIMKEACEQGGNGSCAGYAATAARAGQLDAAWPTILKHTGASDWTNPAPCSERNVMDCDLDDQVAYSSYAESLQWFLGDRGYTPKVFERRDVGNGPSFSCTSARTSTERMICANPALREADVDLAEAYTRAHALSSNRVELRNAQNEFLRKRNAITDPKLMLLAYQDRIQVLKRATD